MQSESSMITVTVMFFGQIRQITGVSQRAISLGTGAKLTDLVVRLNEEYGPSFAEEVSRIQGLRILINGREYSLLGGMQAPLSDGCTVVFMPPIAGG
ncbi:MAG: MoaD family protein [Candidatus Fermentithermobacillus carboniphilus]|uniref:MoaD family protein n=1 Tax=Candidatus Fermentithermobacillus carboniphilus TaxID=3085328 RepID=A0AAT9LHH4_9FIRM|nr:MAG: MoaD family protein [Candidatus Fermentithermobacillus carboniphilus]